MTIIKSFGLPLVVSTIIFGSAGLAHAGPPTLTKTMANLQDFGRAFARMDQERAAAEAERDKAQAELDAIKKGNPQANEQAAKLKKQVDDADAKVRQLTAILEGKKKDPLQDEAHKAEMDRLMKDRADADADLNRAKAAYDDVSKQSTSVKDPGDAQQRVQSAKARIQQLDDALKQLKPMEFEATTEEEVKQAAKLPEWLASLKRTFVDPHKLGSKLTIEPKVEPGSKKGSIVFHWSGYP